MTAPTKRPGRNDPCHCGSGKKYKQCCLDKDSAADAAARAAAAAEATAAPTDAAAAAPTERRPPWKGGTTTRGFVPRARTPRKVGGS
jgi:SEC-C motif